MNEKEFATEEFEFRAFIHSISLEGHLHTIVWQWIQYLPFKMDAIFREILQNFKCSSFNNIIVSNIIPNNHGTERINLDDLITH